MIFRPLVLLLLASCSTPSLTDHIRKFERITKTKVDVPVVLDTIRDADNNVRPNAWGVCFKYPNRVVLNSDTWYNLSWLMQEFLVFHELGHCILNLGHPDHHRNYQVPEMFRNNTCPTSIMESGTTGRKMTEGCYKEFYDYYLGELYE